MWVGVEMKHSNFGGVSAQVGEVDARATCTKSYTVRTWLGDDTHVDNALVCLVSLSFSRSVQLLFTGIADWRYPPVTELNLFVGGAERSLTSGWRLL